MKKILAVVFILMFATIASADSMFTTTIKNTTVTNVQDVLVNYFTEKNFNLDDVSKYRVVFTKMFGDGFWIASRKCYIRCNTLERGSDIKLVVTEEEALQTGVYRKRSIDHIIQYIKEVKNQIDGTPIDQIQNEAVNQLPEAQKEQKTEE